MHSLVELFPDRHERHTKVAESRGQFLLVVSIRRFLKEQLFPEHGGLTVLRNGCRCGANQARDLGESATGFDQLMAECAVRTVLIEEVLVKALSVLKQRHAQWMEYRLVEQPFGAYASQKPVDDPMGLVERRGDAIALATLRHEHCSYASYDCQQCRDQEKPDRNQCGVSPHKLAAAVSR